MVPQSLLMVPPSLLIQVTGAGTGAVVADGTGVADEDDEFR